MDKNLNMKYVILLQDAFKKYENLKYIKYEKKTETKGAGDDLREKSIDKSSPFNDQNDRVFPITKEVHSKSGKKDGIKKRNKETKNFKKLLNKKPVTKNLQKVDLQPQENLKVKKSKKIIKTANDTVHERSISSDDLCKNTKRFTTVKRFSKEEDKALLDFYNEYKNKKYPGKNFYRDIGKRMNRSESSLFHRLKRLKSGILINKQGAFTLLDDQILVDAAIENLKEVKLLRKTTIANRDEVAKKLGRNKYTLISRWYYRLKPWILSYYEKTLNLDIRLILATVIAENFKTIYEIDWEQILERSEFSGHTVGSLRYVFLRMLHLAADHLHLPSDEVTLKQVADDAKHTYTLGRARNISETTKKRQMEVIDYFEKMVQKQNITDYL